MPFTPYHFGIGLAAKSVLPPRFSWLTFCAVQVAIDFETLYYLVRQEHPVHRFFHSLLGAGLAGVVVSLGVLGVLRAWSRLRPSGEGSRWRSHAILRGEVSAPGVWVGGLIGGLSHPLLDGVMHSDMRPFFPWSDSNPLLGIIGVRALHQVCWIAGALGVVGVALWARLREGATPKLG